MDNSSPEDEKKVSTNDSSTPLHDSRLDSSESSNNSSPSWSERLVLWKPVLSLKTGGIRGSKTAPAKKSPAPKVTASRSTGDESTSCEKTDIKAKGGQVVKQAFGKVFVEAPLKIASPIFNLFDSPNDDESPDPPRRELDRSEHGRSSQQILREVLVQPDHSSFWAHMYRTTMLEFGGAALLQGGMHWMGNVLTFLWMLLPTTIVWNLLERFHAYFARVWRAFAGNFAMPRRFRDPWKRWRDYIAQDLIGSGGGGRGRVKWNQWFAAAGFSFAAFAYQTNESIQTSSQRRRLKRRRE
jgi:hypothetical protein